MSSWSPLDPWRKLETRWPAEFESIERPADVGKSGGETGSAHKVRGRKDLPSGEPVDVLFSKLRRLAWRLRRR